MQESCLYLLIFFPSLYQSNYFFHIPVNNVGMLPSFIPSRFLECPELDQVSDTSTVSTSSCPVKFCVFSVLLCKIYCTYIEAFVKTILRVLNPAFIKIIELFTSLTVFLLLHSLSLDYDIYIWTNTHSLLGIYIF